ncbi:MAG: methylenetetrahydrofolate reductase [Bacteroidales bacterium]|nr:methylenetetrahydrofolate reductase [Bacteroidales bacterium]
MKVEKIPQTDNKPFPSLEIVPPLKGIAKTELLDSIRPFMEFGPRYINITCHRDEYEFRPEPDGSFSRHLLRKRISQPAVCAAVQAAFPEVEVVPHLICGGASADLIESQLQDFKFMGIRNILVLRGDALPGEKRFTPEPDGYAHADELVAAIRRFESANGGERLFTLGVGGYPEKHFESPNPETDIQYLKQKVDAGADQIITQMFFDNAVFYDFVRRCREAGITVPIVPGLKPLSSARQVALLPESFSIDIPVELTAEIETHPESAYAIGEQWCKEQCRDLLAHGFPEIHFYTMGRSDNIVNILRDCF